MSAHRSVQRARSVVSVTSLSAKREGLARRPLGDQDRRARNRAETRRAILSPADPLTSAMGAIWACTLAVLLPTLARASSATPNAATPANSAGATVPADHAASYSYDTFGHFLLNGCASSAVLPSAIQDPLPTLHCRRPAGYPHPHQRLTATQVRARLRRCVAW